MADIAVIFHWTEDEMGRLSLSDLAMWRDKAVDRWNRMHGAKE